MLRSAYTSIMDPDFNSLSALPKIVRFQLMTLLSLMWSVIFCSWMGLVSMIGVSMAAHSILLLGIFFTADIFRRSEPVPSTDHRAKYRDPNDGCARYDDIWGA